MACIAMFAALLIWQALTVKDLKRDIERLESQVAAIAQHLKIEIVSKPAVIVVEARK